MKYLNCKVLVNLLKRFVSLFFSPFISVIVFSPEKKLLRNMEWDIFYVGSMVPCKLFLMTATWANSIFNLRPLSIIIPI